MSRTTTRVVSAACLVGAFAYSLPSEACHGSDGDARVVACFTSLHALVATTVFLPADIAYGADGRWLPNVWAAHQIAFAGLATMAGGATTIGLTDDTSAHPGQDRAWGAGLMASGALFIGHGILSLIYNHDTEYPSPSDSSPGPLPTIAVPTIAVLPIDGGAIATLSF